MADLFTYLTDQSRGNRVGIQPLVRPLFAPPSPAVDGAASLFSLLSMLPSALTHNAARGEQAPPPNADMFGQSADLVPPSLRQAPAPLMLLHELASSQGNVEPAGVEHAEDYQPDEIPGMPFSPDALQEHQIKSHPSSLIGHEFLFEQNTPFLPGEPMPATPTTTTAMADLTASAPQIDQQHNPPMQHSRQERASSSQLHPKPRDVQNRPEDEQPEQNTGVFRTEQGIARPHAKEITHLAVETPDLMPANQDAHRPDAEPEHQGVNPPSTSHFSLHRDPNGEMEEVMPLRDVLTITPISPQDPPSHPGSPQRLLHESGSQKMPLSGSQKQVSSDAHPERGSNKPLSASLFSPRSDKELETKEMAVPIPQGSAPAPRQVLAGIMKLSLHGRSDAKTDQEEGDVSLATRPHFKSQTSQTHMPSTSNIHEQGRANAIPLSTSQQRPSTGFEVQPGMIYPALRVPTGESKLSEEAKHDTPLASASRQLQNRDSARSTASTDMSASAEQTSAETQHTASQPIIHIRIGRVEVRGPVSTPGKTVRPAKPARPVLTLNEYLQQRRGNLQ